MLENWMNTFQNAHLLDDGSTGKNYALKYKTALNQFRSTLFAGKIHRLKRKVQHQPQYLYDLNTLKRDLPIRESFYAGIQVVQISSIIGSEGKATDFDIDFTPLNETSQQRWVNLAIAYLSHIPLPLIELIQIGDAYFVRDGHHRISVSRAFGQVAMDAEVITWKASPPFPWQRIVSPVEKIQTKRVHRSLHKTQQVAAVIHKR